MTADYIGAPFTSVTRIQHIQIPKLNNTQKNSNILSCFHNKFSSQSHRAVASGALVRGSSRGEWDYLTTGNASTGKQGFPR